MIPHSLTPPSQDQTPLCISLPASLDPPPPPKKKGSKEPKIPGSDSIPRPISRFLPPGRAWVCSKLPALVKRGQETREPRAHPGIFTPASFSSVSFCHPAPLLGAWLCLWAPSHTDHREELIGSLQLNVPGFSWARGVSGITDPQIPWDAGSPWSGRGTEGAPSLQLPSCSWLFQGHGSCGPWQAQRDQWWNQGRGIPVFLPKMLWMKGCRGPGTWTQLGFC